MVLYIGIILRPKLLFTFHLQCLLLFFVDEIPIDKKVVSDSWQVSENFGLNRKFQLDMTNINANGIIKKLIFHLPSLTTTMICGRFLIFFY